MSEPVSLCEEWVEHPAEVWLRVEELDGSITRVELERCVHTSTPRAPRLGERL